MTAWLPQVSFFDIALTTREEIWLRCLKCEWEDFWLGQTNFGNVVDQAVAHYDENHR